MRKILILLFAILVAIINAQPPTIDASNCMSDQNLYTSSTNPNNSTSSFSYYNLNPNYGTTNFDWVNTQYLTVYAQTNSQGIVTAPATFISPFYCNGSTGNGNCGNNNTALYNNIKQDPSNQYGGSMPSKLKAMDILPEDGWELLKYGFGRAPLNSADPGVAAPNPFIWLYNRYTGKMKLFFAMTNVSLGTGSNPTSALVKIVTSPLGKYDLFANAKPFTHVFSDFTSTTDNNASANADIVALNAASSGLQYYWMYCEFITSYDPCVCRQLNGNNQKLRFEVYLTTTSSVNETLNGSSTPVFSNPSGVTSLVPNTSAASSFKVNDNASQTNLLDGAKEVMKGYKDWKEYADKMKAMFNTKTSNGNTVPTNDPHIINIITTVATSLGQGSANMTTQTKVAFDYFNGTNTTGNNPQPASTEKAIQKLAGLAPLIEDLASAAPYVGAFLALSNFLMDAGSNDNQQAAQPAAPPTAYALDATITGNITQSSLLNSGEVYMPGRYLNMDMSITGQTNADGIFPIYNNPLGVFSVIKVPNFEFKTINLTNNGVDNSDPNLTGYTIYDSRSISTTNAQAGSLLPFTSAFDYKLSGPIEYALNPASNLTVKSIDAAIVLEYQGNEPITLKHGSFIVCHPLSVASGNSGGFTTVSTGNVSQIQVPYYPHMYSEVDPFNSSLTNPHVFSDNLATISSALPGVGLEVEHRSDNFNTTYGTNSADEKFRIRTRYVPVQSVHNQNFILIGTQGNTPKAYLKLFCKFSKNGRPNDEPVTFVHTYDISSRLSSATSTGSGGSGTYNYYMVKDKGTPYTVNKPGDYVTLSHVVISGALPNVIFGASGPLNFSSSQTGGAISQSNINVANATNFINSSATGALNFVANTDIVIGDDVDITTSGSNQVVIMKTGNDINTGKDFSTIPSGTTNKITYFAGNDINVDEGYTLGGTPATIMKMFAGHNIMLNKNTNASSTYYSIVNPCKIQNAHLFAQNDIEVKVTSSSHDVTMLDEAVLSTKNYVPNTYAMLHGDDGSLALTDLVANNTSITGLCGTWGNRMMTPRDTVSQDTLVNAPPTSIDLPEIKPDVNITKTETVKNEKSLLGDEPVYNIGIYPNPSTGDLYINLFTPQGNNIRVVIEDVSGKILYQREMSVDSGSNNNLLRLGNLANGLYILKMSDESGSLIKTQRVILQK